jgi:hypothetical protein
MATRICKLDGFPKIIYGRDFAELLEEGWVYSIRKVCGEIIISKIGKHAKGYDYFGKSWKDLMEDGIPLMTEEEYKNL